MSHAILTENCVAAHNYAPLPVVLVRGQGVYGWDENGRRYLDMMSAYSAVSFGHAHPRLVAALTRQAGTLATCSRAFYTDRLGPFLKRARELTGQDAALPMNSGRSGGNRRQSGAQMGIHGETGRAGPGRDHRVCGKLSRAHHCRFRHVVGAPISNGFWAVPRRTEKHSLWRRPGAAPRDHSEHRRVSGRAHTGQGGDCRSSARLSARMRAAV